MNTKLRADLRSRLAKGARKLARLIRRGQSNLITGSFTEYAKDGTNNCGPGCAGGFIAAAAGFDPEQAATVFDEAKVGLDRVISHNDSLNMKSLLVRLDEINNRFLK